MKRYYWIGLLICLPVMVFAEDIIEIDGDAAEDLILGVGGGAPKPTGGGFDTESVALPAGALLKSAPALDQKNMAVSPDGQWAVSANKDGQIHFYEVATATLVKSFKAHEGGCRDIKFSADGQSVFSCGSDGTVREWNVASNQEMRKFECKNVDVRSLAISQDGRLLAAGVNNGAIYVWDLKSAKQLRELRGHGRENQAGRSSTIDGLDFSPDGRTLISEANDATARLWNVVKGQMSHTLTLHDGSTATVAMSPDGVYGASTRGQAFCEYGSVVRIWSAASGSMLRMLVGHTSDVSCLAFSPDGEYVYTGARDLTLRQWHVASGLELRRWKLNSMPQNVVCTLDGAKVITLSQQEGLTVWDPHAKLTEALIPASKMVAPQRALMGPSVLDSEESTVIMGEQAAAAAATAQVDPNENIWQGLGCVRYAQRLSTMLAWLKLAPEEAVKDLGRRLRDPLSAEASIQATKALESLDDENFGTRMQAAKTLSSLGSEARPLLLRGLESSSLQVRVSTAQILKEIGGPDDIRLIMVCELLAQIGTPSAREVLRKIATRPCAEASHARAVLRQFRKE